MAGERRIQKLEAVIREEIGPILDREVEFPDGTLVTVTRVSLAPDLRQARVHVSILGAKVRQALEILEKNRYDIQRILVKKLRTRPVPNLSFALDREELKREGIEKSLSELKKKGEL